jgi:hypothetical protein
VKDPNTRASFLKPILIPSPEKKLEQVLKDTSPRTLVSKIPITQFRPNQIHLKESKLSKVEESKNRGNASPCKSPCKFTEALRLPNITVRTQGLRSTSPSTTGGSSRKTSDGYSSPTDILSADNDELQGQVFDNLKTQNEQ